MDKIICAGKNYLGHAEELGDAVPQSPVFFMKPSSSLVHLGKSEQIELPHHLGVINYEAELVFKIRRENPQGEPYFCGWTIGLDLTLRDQQTQLKANGHPWERAKAFPRSALIGEFLGMGPTAKQSETEILNQEFSLTLNGQIKQKARGVDMRWSPQELLNQAHEAFFVCDGDLLFTGTPVGVGPLKMGDRVEVRAGDLHYSFSVA